MPVYGPYDVGLGTGTDTIGRLITTLSILIENLLATGVNPLDGSVTDDTVAADAEIAQSKIAGLVADLADRVTAAQLATGLATKAPSTGIAQSAVTGLVADLAGKATPAQVTAAVDALVAAAPGTLDTLNELAAALGDDPNFAATITTALAGKQATITPGTYAAAAPPAGIGPNAGGYDRALNVYNLKPSHLRRTRAALAKAKAGTGYASFAFLGDSTIAGTGASNVATKSWPAQLAATLVAAGVPSGGSGLVPWYRNSTPADTRVTFPGGWAVLQGDTNLVANSTNGSALVLAPTNTGTIARVYYSNTSGPFIVSVDGAAAVPVTPTGAASLGIYEVTGLANTTHTIAVARVSGGCHQIGAEVANATGLRTYNAGVGGIPILWLAGIAGPVFFGLPQVAVTASASGGFGADLAIIDCELNDTLALTAVADFETRWQTVITAAKATGADVVMKTAIPGSALTMAPYTQKLYNLADANDVPLIDNIDRWGSYASANGLGLMADTYHPNDAGYADVDLAVVRALGLAA